jgi:uncharacterized protein
VEDELILALPVVPVKPGTAAVDVHWTADDAAAAPANPFAVLETMKLSKR